MINEIARPYRRSRQLKELSELYAQSQGNKSAIIWQNNDGHRYVYSSDYFNINKKFRTFMFVIKESAGFDLSKPIYIRFEEGMMFKATGLNMIEECLTLKMPEEFMAYEYRDYPRIKFTPDDSEFAHIILESDIVKSATQELSFQIIDFSEQGIALNLSDIHLRKFKESKKIILKKLFMVSLAKEIELELIYHKKIRYKKDGEIYTSNRCGLKTKQPIEQYLLKLYSH